MAAERCDVLRAGAVARLTLTGGNRMQQSLSLNGGATTVTNYAYNAANQLIQAGSANLTYDSNGNMLNDGTNAYTWDRANRLLSMGGASYAYDGEGRRVKQTVGATVTKYLLDLQPGLSVVLSQDVGGNITRFVHAPTGIFARKDSAGGWHWTEQDALGTVRGEVAVFGGVEGTVMPDPYGNTFAQSGVVGTPYYFTGEPYDLGTGLTYLRARYLNSQLGVFPSLDPFEGMAGRPMSLNGYSWVEGNVVSGTDASGNCALFQFPTKTTSISLLKFLNNGDCPIEPECKASSDTECQDCCWTKYSRVFQFSSWSSCVDECNNYSQNQQYYRTLIEDQRCDDLQAFINSQVLSNQYKGRQVLTNLIRYAYQKYSYMTSRELSDDISCAVTGARGADTLYQASQFGTRKRPYQSLGAGGWNPTYDDTTVNQAFHFWAYVITVAQGDRALAVFGDFFHECLDPFDAQRTLSDSRLAMAGIILGILINDGYPADQVSSWVDEWVGDVKTFYDLIEVYGLDFMEEYLNTRFCPLIDKTR
ncbi:MAG: RHS repeat-associated core domain-containing protein [Anaerolineae bacterium]|nr:RHS repeat-associated core domain-containing protein [Anaerolineae bacterium]